MNDTTATTRTAPRDRTLMGEAFYYGTHVKYWTYFGHVRTGVLTGKHTWVRGVMFWEIASDTVDIPARAPIFIPSHDIVNLDLI